jgi:hypothetical protein
MKIRRRGLLVGVICVITSFAVLVLMTSPALALTAKQKGSGFDECRASGGTFKECCHAYGGSYQVEYNQDGSIKIQSCSFNDDPMVGPSRGLFNSALGGALATNGGSLTTGPDTSGAASGGVSRAGENGIVTRYDTPVIIP